MTDLWIPKTTPRRTNHPADVPMTPDSGILLPAGTIVTPASFPLHDVTLTNGVRLQYRGEEDLVPPAEVAPPLHCWIWLQEPPKAPPVGAKKTKLPPFDPLKIIGSMDPGPHGMLAHISVSYARSDPSWRTLADVKAAFFGDLDVAMVLPRVVDYVNVHRHTFHLHQMPVVWGIR